LQAYVAIQSSVSFFEQVSNRNSGSWPIIKELSYVQNVNHCKTSVKTYSKRMQFKFFVGIDVSKATLDFSVVTEGKQVLSFRIENSVRAIKAALKVLRKLNGFCLSQTLFCLEQTGLYHNHLTFTLHSMNANVWIEKAIEIKRSSGLQRGKSDKVDAQRIAFFAYRNRDKAKLWSPPRVVIEQLKRLTGLRDRLLIMISQLAKPIKESESFDLKSVSAIIKNCCQASLKAIKADVKKVEKQIMDVIKSDASLTHLFKIITSVGGIGKVIACDMILTTNEFKNITDPKKYACYSGVVPFEHSSGSSIRGRTRVSHFANKNSKRLLHLAAMSIIRYPGELKTYWLRKLEEGKHKMVVINAIRNKLIQRVFAVVKRGSQYKKNYTNALA
jgi:transposase